MLSADLTQISTFGWYDAGEAESIFVFGWAFEVDLTGAADIGYIVAFAGAGFVQTNTFGISGP